MNHQMTLEEIGLIPKTKESFGQGNATQKDYAFPCGGCACNHCANSVECFDNCTGEADFGCFTCDECRRYDGKGIVDNYRDSCVKYKVTTIHAKRIRKTFKAVKPESGNRMNKASMISMILKFDECKQCEKRTRDIYNCIHICDKPLVALNEFNKYKNLEEQGKLLKLPCKVGDTVYRINKGKKEPIIPMRVIGIAIRNENELVIQAKDIADDNHNLYSKNSIGKAVFLTREVAEAALKEMSE